MTRTATYIKAITAGAVMCIGGPALVMYISPSEEEIFKRYNPELQKRSLEMRGQREKEFDEFVTGLKEASKSNKPIWIAQKEIEKKQSEERAMRLRMQHDAAQADAERQRSEVRAAAVEEQQPQPSKGWKSWIGL